MCHNVETHCEMCVIPLVLNTPLVRILLILLLNIPVVDPQHNINK